MARGRREGGLWVFDPAQPLKPTSMSLREQPLPEIPDRTAHSFDFFSLVWWKRSGFWLVGFFALLVLFIAGLTPPVIAGRGKNPTVTQAVNNARQIGMGLMAFEEKFGSMPDAETAVNLGLRVGTDWKLGTRSSNDFLRQLLASEVVSTEEFFYAKIPGVRKPDNVFSGARALEKGECAYAYFPGATPHSHPDRPLAAAPLVPGTDRFDPVPFEGRAVVLRADLSVTVLPIIVSSGRIKVMGVDFFDPMAPAWEGAPPVIAWPE